MPRNKALRHVLNARVPVEGAPPLLPPPVLLPHHGEGVGVELFGLAFCFGVFSLGAFVFGFGFEEVLDVLGFLGGATSDVRVGAGVVDC